MINYGCHLFFWKISCVFKLPAGGESATSAAFHDLAIQSRNGFSQCTPYVQLVKAQEPCQKRVPTLHNASPLTAPFKCKKLMRTRNRTRRAARGKSCAGFNCPSLLPVSNHHPGGICISFAKHHSDSWIVVAIDFGSLKCKATGWIHAKQTRCFTGN